MRRSLVLLSSLCVVGVVRSSEPYPRYETAHRAPPRLFEDDATGTRYQPGSSRRPGAKGGVGLSALRKGNKKYGVMCIGGGTVVTMLGMTLMFERNLMRLGNLLQVAGVALLLGPARVLSYLTQRSKLRGASVFAVGFLLMMNGRSFVGFLLELFGIVNLFGNMFPVLWSMIQRMPVVRELTRKPPAAQRRPRYSEYEDEDPYESPRRDYDNRYAPRRRDYDDYRRRY